MAIAKIGLPSTSRNIALYRGASLLATTAWLSIGSPAQAQTVTTPLPPPTDLARPQAPLIAPEAPPPVRPAPPSPMPVEASTTQVDITTVVIEGVTAYPANTFEPEIAALNGKRVALSEVFAAAARIEARYRRDGYVLARAIVPAQTVADGRYRIQVIEGYVADVSIDGDTGEAKALLASYFEPVTRNKPARLSDIERALLLANDLQGYAVRSVLTPIADTPGAARLAVTVTRKPVDFFATLNNRGSSSAGPVTGTVGLSLNGIGSFAGHVGALYYTTFNNEQNFGELSLDGHFGSGGLKLRGWVSYGTSVPGSILAPLEILSRSLVAGVSADYPILRSRRISISAHGSFEATRDRTRVLGTPLSEDRQRIVRLGLSGDARDDWGGISTLGITLHQGLDILGASHDGEAVPQSRLAGRSDFFKVTATASRVQPLWSGHGGSIALQLSAAAQIAADKLLSLEQFHIGGEQFGRGFNPAQASGDHGVGGDAELQYTHYSPIGPLTGQQLYVFFDAAAVRDRASGLGWQRFQSAGGGIRFDVGPRWSGQFELAVPYRGGRLVDGKTETGVQAFFRITARY